MKTYLTSYEDGVSCLFQYGLAVYADGVRESSGKLILQHSLRNQAMWNLEI